MKINNADFILTSLMLLLQLYLRCDALAMSVYNNVNENAQVCHDGFMSVYLSKVHFIDLPFTIYVQGKWRHYKGYLMDHDIFSGCVCYTLVLT